MKRGSAGRLAVVLMALISTLLLAQGTAMAASFTFLELTDRVALSVDTEHAIFNCGASGPRYPKACELIFASPTGTTTVDALRTGPTFWTEAGNLPRFDRRDLRLWLLDNEIRSGYRDRFRH